MKIINRRKFIFTLGLTAVSTQIPNSLTHAQLLPVSPPTIIKPPKLKPGDTIGLISPGGIVDSEDVESAKATLRELGLKVKLGKHILDRYGYLAGKDKDRAADINTMFADKSVKAIVAMRGGWGCNRILHLINYPLIRSNPKIIMGYSDITSLLLAINARSHLVTFHGPVGISNWNEYTLNYLKPLLFQGKAVTMRNISGEEGRLETVTPGKVQGKLIGGNLSVICAMLGSPYLPSWNRRILFVEDISEDIYRVDRMLTQLKTSGRLYQLAGFIFAQCTRCKNGDDPTFTLQQVLNHHIKPLGIPAWYGSMIGHIKNKFTIPIGVDVEIDAGNGTITMLDIAVI